MDRNTRKQRPNRPDVPSPGYGVSNIQFTGITIDHLGIVWREVVPMLTPALGEDELIDHVERHLHLGTAQLWIAADPERIHAAAVTEIVTKGKRKYCNIWLTGGSGVNNWLKYINTIERWAKEQGCHAMLIEKARSGWKHLLPDYSTKTITLTKEL